MLPPLHLIAGIWCSFFLLWKEPGSACLPVQDLLLGRNPSETEWPALILQFCGSILRAFNPGTEQMNQTVSLSSTTRILIAISATIFTQSHHEDRQDSAVDLQKLNTEWVNGRPLSCVHIQGCKR